MTRAHLFWRFLLVGLLGSGVAGCGAVEPAAPTAAVATPVPVTLRLATADSGDALKPFEPIIASFEQRYPWITVQIESSRLNDYYGDLLQQVEAGTPPDVLQIGEERLPVFASRGALDNLTRYLDSPGASLDPAIYYPGVFRPGQWQGEPYLLPKDFSTMGVFYNKRLFDAAGVPYPQRGWTWQDLQRTAAALTDPAKGQYGIQLPANWVRGFEYWVSAAGGRLISEDGAKIEGYMNGPSTVEALTFYRELYTSGVAAPQSDVDTLETPRDDFAQGKAAMRFYGRWPQASYLQAAELKAVLGVAPPPAGKQPANVIAWAGFGITAGSSHKQEAWLLVRYLSGADGSREWANWGLPAVKAVAEERGIATNPLDSVWLGNLSELEPLAAYASPYWGEAGEPAIQQAIGEALQQPDADIKAILDRAARTAQQALDERRSK